MQSCLYLLCQTQNIYICSTRAKMTSLIKAHKASSHLNHGELTTKLVFMLPHWAPLCGQSSMWFTLHHRSGSL